MNSIYVQNQVEYHFASEEEEEDECKTIHQAGEINDNRTKKRIQCEPCCVLVMRKLGGDHHLSERKIV